VATEVRTSFPDSSEDSPAFEPRENAPFALPPLVMPAIEPGWDAFLAGAAAFADARTPLCRPFLVSFSRCSATAVLARRHRPDAGALAFTRVPV
jgi:hypothetical protein